jgi:hypothetical protein
MTGGRGRPFRIYASHGIYGIAWNAEPSKGFIHFGEGLLVNKLERAVRRSIGRYQLLVCLPVVVQTTTAATPAMPCDLRFIEPIGTADKLQMFHPLFVEIEFVCLLRTLDLT